MKMKSENKRYCAFLRGVNVKGTNMKMSEVCSVFENAGMNEVTAILASGNIIFSSTEIKEGTRNHESPLKVVLEEAMSMHFDYESKRHYWPNLKSPRRHPVKRGR